MHNNPSMVKTLISPKSFAFLQTTTKDSPLELSWLLSATANLNSQTSDGSTPLILAAANGYTDLVRSLLNANATVTVADEVGCIDALHSALEMTCL